MVARNLLLRCLEDILFTMPEEMVQPLEIEGVRGRITQFSMPYLNMAGIAPGQKEITKETIEAVRNSFSEQGKAFGWLHTEEAPPETPALLEAAGFFKAEVFGGLVHRDLAREIEPARDLRIVEVGPEERERYIRLHGGRLGMPEDAMTFMVDALYFNANSPCRWRNYFCYLDGEDDPISTASMMYFREAPVIYLAGAVTDPKYRGRGAYTSLLARRFADAHADGIEAAVIQAVRSTSAPICAKHGFEEITAHELYVWSP